MIPLGRNFKTGGGRDMIVASKSLWSVLAVALVLVAPRAMADAQVPIAVIDFDYSDTSGEPRDQRAEHQARLGDFAAKIRSDLAQSGKYRIVTIACPENPCTAKNIDAKDLFAAAKAAGAKLLLYGGVHKMSTLVQWAKVQLVDVEANRLLDDRHLSFRGDTDEAWRRAADFVAEKLKAQDFSK